MRGFVGYILAVVLVTLCRVDGGSDVYSHQRDWLIEHGALHVDTCCEVAHSSLYTLDESLNEDAVTPREEERRDERGLFAKKAYSRGDVIFTIPWTTIIHAKHPSKTLKAVKRVLKAEHITRSQTVALTVLVLAESGRGGSIWDQEFASLPAEYNNAPFFNEESIPEQAGCSLQKAAGKFVAKQFQEYYTHRIADLCVKYPHVFRDPTSCSESRYLWARNAVHTRAFRLVRDDAKGTVDAIVPFASFINHAPNGTNNVKLSQSVKEDYVEVVATADINLGDEFTLAYRDRLRAKEAQDVTDRVYKPSKEMAMNAVTIVHYGFTNTPIVPRPIGHITPFPSRLISNVFRAQFYDPVSHPKVNATSYLLSLEASMTALTDRLSTYPSKADNHSDEDTEMTLITQYCDYERHELAMMYDLVSAEYIAVKSAYCDLSGSGKTSRFIPEPFHDPWQCSETAEEGDGEDAV